MKFDYAIGVDKTVLLMVNTFVTGKITDDKIEHIIKSVFDLRPGEIIDYLQLRRPIFRKTATYGHFGRNDDDFTWEKTDKKEELKIVSEEILGLIVLSVLI